jgi:hypothetical protein
VAVGDEGPHAEVDCQREGFLVAAVRGLAIHGLGARSGPPGRGRGRGVYGRPLWPGPSPVRAPWQGFARSAGARTRARHEDRRVSRGCGTRRSG